MKLFFKKYSLLCFITFSFTSLGVGNSLSDILTIELDSIVSYNSFLADKKSSIAVDSSSIEAEFEYSLYPRLTLYSELEIFWDKEVQLKIKDAHLKYDTERYVLRGGIYTVPIPYFKSNDSAFIKKLAVYKPLSIKNKDQLGFGGIWNFNSKNYFKINLSTEGRIFKNSNILLSLANSQKNYEWAVSYFFRKNLKSGLFQAPVSSVGLSGFWENSSFFNGISLQVKGESWMTDYLGRESVSPVYSGYIFPKLRIKRLSLGVLTGYMCHIRKSRCRKGSFDYVAQIAWDLTKKNKLQIILESFTRKDFSLITEQIYSLRLRGEF